MARKILPFVALLGAVALVAVGLSHVAWRGDRRGSFVVGCLWSHTLRDDPIVWPDAPGASHSHDFFGNVTTNAFSTRSSLLEAATTCRNPADTAAVWSPSTFLGGDQLTPLRERAYYFGAGRRDVRSMPADLKMIAGDAAAADPEDNPHVGWFCGGDTPISDHPYDCTPYRTSGSSVDGVTAFADFPQCWDGVHLDSPDHRSHVVYRSGRSCPSDHPVLIPRLRVRVHLGVWDPCVGDRPCSPTDTPEENIALTLASGPYWTFHADFWNTWRQDALDDLVERCLRARRACHAAE